MTVFEAFNLMFQAGIFLIGMINLLINIVKHSDKK